VGLTKKFEALIEPTDYDLLVKLSKHFGLSKAAILRLALRDLNEKIQKPSSPTPDPINPILRKAEADTPPPELDPFWQNFRQ
jgi:hypothetical protein